MPENSRSPARSGRKPRLLIIGASGFVGSRWAPAAAAHFDVVGAARRGPADGRFVTLDITDTESIRAAFDDVRPQLVTLLAALSDIDRCQREQQLAEEVNHQGAVHVALQCARAGARLLYTSTDAVFDGTLGMYQEGDPPTPPNWYGETKARAERSIAEVLPGATIVRPSLILGTSGTGRGNSYLEKVIANLRAGNEVVSPTYEYRNPIDVTTLCEFLAELSLRDDATGIFHVGASDKISRYNLARAIAERTGLDADHVVPQTEPVPGRAPRGVDDFLSTGRLRHFCRTPVPTCQQVIERALADV